MPALVCTVFLRCRLAPRFFSAKCAKAGLSNARRAHASAGTSAGRAGAAPRVPVEHRGAHADINAAAEAEAAPAGPSPRSSPAAPSLALRKVLRTAAPPLALSNARWASAHAPAGAAAAAAARGPRPASEEQQGLKKSLWAFEPSVDLGAWPAGRTPYQHLATCFSIMEARRSPPRPRKSLAANGNRLQSTWHEKV